MFENLYSELLEALSHGEEVALVSYMNPESPSSGSIVGKKLVSRAQLKSGLDESGLSTEAELIDESFNTGVPQSRNIDGRFIMVEPYFPKPRLIVFGGGHIAKPLSELAAKSEFDVTVVDDRPMFANSGRFPEAQNVICKSFENAFDELKLRSSDFVVIVTRGHVHDGICIREALKHELSYLGMIGSKRRVKGMMDTLREEGYSEERLASVSSPIGLDIGAVTPFEIAVSIIAEVIEYRRLRNGGRDSARNKKFNWPEFDREVLETMCAPDENRALVTIISSKGSVPRKAGAKMVVYLDGRLLGSIGGGCSEAGVITLARDIIRDKGYCISSVDMTGEVAEELGMVCGGVMDVLIES